MKKLMMILAIAFLSLRSYAGTSCNLNQDVNNQGTFSSVIFQNMPVLANQTGDFISERILVKPDGTVLQNFDMSQISTLREAQTYAGSTFVYVSQTTGKGSLMLGLGVIDPSKSNFVALNALATGSIDLTLSSPTLNVIDGARMYSLSCIVQ